MSPPPAHFERRPVSFSQRTHRAFLLLLIQLPAVGCSSYQAASSNPRLTIAIVGDGVPDSEPPPPATIETPVPPLGTPNTEQGRAMYNGAITAFNHSKRDSLAALRKICRIESYNDRGNVDEAMRIATLLSLRPDVLVAIGHGTSATTKAAAHCYAGAGIPLIMPIATSPSIKSKNCFRLPLADDIQARLAEKIVRSDLKVKACFLIHDTSQAAGTYSDYLSEQIKRQLGPLVVGNFDLSGPKQATELPVAIKANRVDAIIYCGYANRVNEVIERLRELYQHDPTEKKPPLLLTDSCKFQRLNLAGFKAFVTFPAPPLDPSSDEAMILAKSIDEDESYQMFGYDSILLTAEVVSSLSNRPLNRATFIKGLRDLQDFKAVSLTYRFPDTENMRSDYYVYEAKGESPHKTTFKPHAKSNPGDLPTLRN